MAGLPKMRSVAPNPSDKFANSIQKWGNWNSFDKFPGI